eukprot:gnl/TRDRNA2_/TRDRNA2_150511_c0_seq2.p1 gnl/TRDRNA2_/TRDRNA2_150511_c0~~gnl/TRDRNA2_/TRDRNA2_150511_c0_seq2.p1  ORF type:complete len:126 (+),score=5.71 gnl/TRDRNA2_/TRDRNA2_150511_c0_seq2:38-379(+)
MSWIQHDARELESCEQLEAWRGSFGLVLDKTLLDTLLCSPTAEADIQRYLRGVRSLMDPVGLLLCISLNDPSRTLPHLKDPQHEFSVTSTEMKTRRGATVHCHYCRRCEHFIL